MHPEVKKGKGWAGPGVLVCVGDLQLSAVLWSQTPAWAPQGDGSEDVPSPFITPKEDTRRGTPFLGDILLKAVCHAQQRSSSGFLWQGGDKWEAVFASPL